MTVAPDSSRETTSTFAPRAFARADRARIATVLGVRAWLWAFVVIGAGLRLWQYAINRSLWLDEAFAALNIFDRNMHQLVTESLDFNQAVPPGFLAVEKVVTDVFGNGEYALRAFPLVCGLAALPLFVLVAREALEPTAAVAATALVAVSAPLVYYSSEVKPYAGDVAASLALSAIAFAILRGRVSRTEAVLFGLAGVVLMQLSYAGILVAAGTGFVVAAVLVAERRRRSLANPAITLGLWAVGGILFLLVSLHNFSSYSGLDSGEGSKTAPLTNLHWYWVRLTHVGDAAGIYHALSSPAVVVSILGGLLAIAGAVHLVARSRLVFAVLLAPAVVTAVVSAAGKFPILTRTVLFLAPLLYLLIAAGAAAVWKRVGHVAFACGIAAVTLLPIAVDAGWARGSTPFAPVRNDDIKPALRYVANHWKGGDVLYVHYATQYAFGYYRECGCFELPRKQELNWSVVRLPIVDRGAQFPRAFESTSRNLIIGRYVYSGEKPSFGDDVTRIAAHRRAWVLVTWTFGANERAFIRSDLLNPLSGRGRESVALAGEGMRLYRFDFTAKP